MGACLKCQGDLVYDDGDWLCLQCGVYYYTSIHGYPDLPRDSALRIAALRHGLDCLDDTRPFPKAG